MASFTPISFNSMRSEWIRSSRPSRTLSVSSSISAEGARPDSARTRRTPSTKPGSRNWRAAAPRARRPQPGPREPPPPAVDKTWITELAGRHVHADVHRRMVGGPAHPPDDVRGRLPEHPGAEGDDVAGLLGQFDELAGLHHAP